MDWRSDGVFLRTGKTSPEISRELFFVMRFARCISAGLAPGGPVSARICGA